MRRLSTLLATLLALTALAGFGQPRELLPTPPPWTPVPLSPLAISPENAGQVRALHCLQDDAWVQGLAFSPDGWTLASSAEDATLCLWGLAP